MSPHLLCVTLCLLVAGELWIQLETSAVGLPSPSSKPFPAPSDPGYRLSLYLMSASATGPADAAITQTPRYRVIPTGKQTTLECTQHMNHFAMFWYRQDPGQGLRLIYYSGGVDNTAEGDVTEGYSVSRKENEHFPLTLESASTEQSSLYFCGSSESTALHSQLLSAQKGSHTQEGHVPPEASVTPGENAASAEVPAMGSPSEGPWAARPP